MDNATDKTKAGVGHIVFYALVIVLFLWTASNTLSFVSRAMPEHPYARWFALAIFDVGAVAWLVVYMKMAQAGNQRSISFVMVFVDTIGALLMVFGELVYESGYQLAGGEQLQVIATWAIGVWTALNFFAVIGYHLADQSTRFNLAMREIHDDIKESAIKDVRAQVNAIKADVANELGTQMKSDILSEFGLRPGKYGALPTGRTIEHHPGEGSRKRKANHGLLSLLRNGGNGAKSYASETDNGTDPKNV